ncbi:MAG: hypothetical protein ACRDTT_34090, partial [Pseudonocardiaceae bacterium]
FYWPPSPHHHSGGHDADVRVMEEVMAIMERVLTPSMLAADADATGRLKPAKLVFRDILLGISLPELHH